MSFFFGNTEKWYLYRLWSGFIPLSARDWRGFHVLGYNVVYRLVHYLRQRQVVFSSIYHVLYINVEYKHVLKCIYKKTPKKYQHTENYIKVKPMLKIKKKNDAIYIVKLHCQAMSNQYTRKMLRPSTWSQSRIRLVVYTSKSKTKRLSRNTHVHIS